VTRGAGGPRIARPLLFLLLALPAAAGRDEALARAREARLWDAPEWRRLLHYKPSGGGWRGDATEGMYFSPAGRADPRAELEAAVEALYDRRPAADGDDRFCGFPARRAWLLERLGEAASDARSFACPRYEEWRALLGLKSATLVFASAYMSNPSSMFGHTFLRLGRGQDDPLRDNTLNFAAETGEDGALAFTAKGLLGLYPGRYTAMPYHMKVQEYAHIESRDLWEYPLALSPEELERLADHAWEMGRSTFPYYFFSKNCSYQLMPALEAAAPRLTLMPGTPAIVGPVDTLLAVTSAPGLAGEARYRPSHATTLRARRALLSSSERRAAKAFADGRPEEGERLWPADAGRRALVLDAAQDLVLYRHGFSPEVAESVRLVEREILVRRARLSDPPREPARPWWAVPPEQGHSRRRLSVGAGARRGGGFAELAWRPGYHDWTDRPRGFVPGAAIHGFSATARYDGATRRAYLHDARLVEILSASPWDSWTRKPAWAAGTGLETAYEKGGTPSRALVYEGHFGTGLAAWPWEGGELFALAQLEGAAGAVLREGWRAGGALRGGAAANLGASWRAALEGALSAHPFGDPAPNHRLAASLNWAPSRDRALRLRGAVRGPHREIGLHAILHH
jgi:hypothetical protein